MIEYHDPSEPFGIDLGTAADNAALARVFESGALRRAFDQFVAHKGPWTFIYTRPDSDEHAPDAYGRNQLPFTD